MVSSGSLSDAGCCHQPCSAHCGTVPSMQSLPCLPCFTLDPGSISLAGQPALDAPWHLALLTSVPEKSREDRDVDGDGIERLWQKTDISSCQWNIEYSKEWENLYIWYKYSGRKRPPFSNSSKSYQRKRQRLTNWTEETRMGLSAGKGAANFACLACPQKKCFHCGWRRGKAWFGSGNCLLSWEGDRTPYGIIF